MINDQFKTRYHELHKEFQTFRFVKEDEYDFPSVRNGAWRKWATSAENLIVASFGAQSVQTGRFVECLKGCDGREYNLRGLFAIFESAHDDFLNGYRFNVELSISGEIFGDFVALARESLAQGHKDVAAVLASAALEDALKRYASANGISVIDVDMQNVINALKSKGLVGGAQKTLLDTMPRIRNAALHADWAKLTEPDVNSVIGFVEQFLLVKFSPP